MASTRHGYTATTKSGEHLLNREVGDGSYFTYGTFSFKSCITREITSLSTKKKKIFYIQKSTVHSVTLILDDPLYISNFDTRKVMPFLFLKTCMYLLFCTLHLFYTYFIFFKFTSGYILTWSLIRW